MKCESTLPLGYKEYYKVDMQNDKRLMILVNLIAVIIGVIMVVVANMFIPFGNLFNTDAGVGLMLIRCAVLILSSIVYVVLHELMHGVAMKLCGTKKVKFGATLMYAFAGSDDYYYKKPYIFIALLPVVLWGAVLFVFSLFLPPDWFWVAYLIQVMNVSGAAGDFYVTFKFIFFPRDILIKDKGTSMTVYSAS